MSLNFVVSYLCRNTSIKVTGGIVHEKMEMYNLQLYSCWR